MEDLTQQFARHEVHDAERFGEIRSAVNDVSSKLTVMLTNHLPHMQIAEEKTANDVGWIMKIGGSLLTVLLAVTTAILIKLFVTH